MEEDEKIKQQVREFYNEVGWQTVSDGLYQNAHYEDLRPVSREYIHRCHLRVCRHLPQTGRFMLDAGSGPVQYAEYLLYSQGFTYRVCADISIQALREARKRLNTRGLYVVADVANLPFKANSFDGEVSLHTLHHLNIEDQFKAYDELYRVLEPGKTAVVVNGWSSAPLMRRFNWLIRLMDGAWHFYARLRGKEQAADKAPQKSQAAGAAKSAAPIGTFVRKMDAKMLKEHLQGRMKYEIFVWRSVSVHFLRSVFHPALGGKFWLKVLYNLEERFPHYFGENGQYPLIVIEKETGVSHG